MPKSLAELRTSPSTGLPRRSYPLCLAQSLLSEMGSLTTELGSLTTEQAIIEGRDDDGPQRPMRVNGTPRLAEIKTRVAEIQARMETLDVEMADHTGELVVEGTDVGVWSRWTDEHPAREEGQPGYGRDLRVAGGYCNGDDLIASLGTYAKTWNGEPITESDWEFIRSKAAPGDLGELARLLVVMHETAVDLPKWRSIWRESLTSFDD